MMESITEVISDVDLNKMSDLHRKNYPNGHFTKYFSASFLASYYKFFVEKGCLLLVHRDSSNEIDGFVLSGEKLGEHIGEFKRMNKLRLIKEALLNPIPLTRLIFSKLSSFFSLSSAGVESEFLILSIVTDKETKGVGSNLMMDLLELEKDRNIGLFVKVSNVNAINFYLRYFFVIKFFSSGQYYMEFDKNSKNGAI